MAKTQKRKPKKKYAKEITPKANIVNPWGEDQISTTDTYLFRTRIRHYNPDDLVGKKGLQIYDQMRKDEQVKAALTAINYAVLATGYTIEPPELETEEDPMGEEVTEFVKWNLAEMKGHFDSKILNLMEARIYGYVVGELVYFPIDFGEFTGKVGLKDIKFRRPEGIYFDVDEHGDLAEDGILQAEKRLPVEKFLLYSYSKTYDNPYGESEFRAIYKSWWSKDIFQRFMAIALERYGEPIWVFTHEGRITNTQRTQLENFIKNLQSKTGIIIPKFIVADPKTPPPRTAEAFIPAINLENGEIRMGLLLPGLMGLSAEREVGSLARSKTEFDVFLWIVQRNRNDIETAINEQSIKRVVDLNYEVTGGKYPTFKFNAITEEFKHRIFGIWREAVASRALTKTRKDENKARDLIGFPKLPEDIAVTDEAQTVEEKERMKETTVEGEVGQDGLPDLGDEEEEGDEEGDILTGFFQKTEFNCVYCRKHIYHLPGEHDQCDHSPTGECAPEELKSKEDRLSKAFDASSFDTTDKKAIKGYKDFGFASINRLLRDGDTGLGKGANADAAKSIKGLDAAFAKAPKLSEPITVYRGFKSRAVLNNADKLVNKTLDSKAFLSTSFDAKAIGNFLSADDSIGLRVNLPKGMRAIYTDPVSSNKERELLLPRNLKIKIKRTVKIGGKLFLDADVVQ